MQSVELNNDPTNNIFTAKQTKTSTKRLTLFAEKMNKILKQLEKFFQRFNVSRITKNTIIENIDSTRS